jgi:hypothetical protein
MKKTTLIITFLILLIPSVLADCPTDPLQTDFTMNESCLIESLTITNQSTLNCDGFNITTNATPSNFITMDDNTGLTNCNIQDLEIRGTSATIYIQYNTSNVLIENNNIYTEPTSVFSIDFNTSQTYNLTIKANTFTGTPQNTIRHTTGTTHSDITIENNQFVGQPIRETMLLRRANLTINNNNFTDTLQGTYDILRLSSENLSNTLYLTNNIFTNTTTTST